MDLMATEVELTVPLNYFVATHLSLNSLRIAKRSIVVNFSFILSLTPGGQW